MQDVINREITVKASAERVYGAIADPKQIVTWFPDAVEGSLEVGQRSVLVFSDHNHKSQIYVEAAKPFEYFAYRWIPGGTNTDQDVLKASNTLVEFRIEETDGGTKVVLTESGFAALPVEVMEQSFKENSGGWEYMMGRLEKAMDQT